MRDARERWGNADAVRQIEQNVDAIRAALGPWAAHMAARYRAAVYLVGSTLHHPVPRDCDIRIIVEDHSFAARFGYDLHQIELDEHHPLRRRQPSLCGAAVVRWSEEGPTQRWIDDVSKFNDHLSLRHKLNMDIQIWPDSYWREPYPEPVLLATPTPRWWFYTKFCPDPCPAALDD